MTIPQKEKKHLGIPMLLRSSIVFDGIGDGGTMEEMKHFRP